MEINILENKKSRMVFELRGADHTFCNPLKNELLKTKGVLTATYAIDHPMVGVPKFIIETDGISPKDAILKAISSLKKRNKEFLTAFKKA